PYSSQTAGIFLKATNGWDNVDNKGTSGNGTDNFGFSALPGGDAVMQSNKLKFSSIGYDGNWWSSTNNNDNAYWTSISTRIMGSKRFDFTQFQEGNKKSFYMSVRCIKD
ncbi:MAG: fibrobacter succinogenes major paralogous domain-containing protein, partial [Fibromonadaceae bacterium]|nr:fibrobacter succinogenes major paralogous domain-containing protein [Fibromonadaceae bacterium]